MTGAVKTGHQPSIPTTIARIMTRERADWKTSHASRHTKIIKQTFCSKPSTTGNRRERIAASLSYLISVRPYGGGA